MEVLLEKNWYDEIFVNRLIVGHTHNAVDQVCNHPAHNHA